MTKKRAKLPGADVLFGDYQNPKQENVSTLNNQDVETLKQQNSKNAKYQKSKPAKQRAVKTVKQQNVMTTVYFTPDTVKEIEKAKVKLLTDYDLKTNKSQIIEVAVKTLIQDIDQLSHLLVENKTK